MPKNRKYYLITLSFLYSFYHYFLTKKDLGQLWEVIPSANDGTIPVNTLSYIDRDTTFL